MNKINTSIEIDAPSETVWEVLTDFEKYGEWNPYMRIIGEPVEGTKLVVGPGPESGRMPKFKPRVIRSVPGEELRWLGHLYIGGLYDGEHRFMIEDIGKGRSKLIHSEDFKGILVGLINRKYGKKTEENFRGINKALKDRAETMAKTQKGM